MNTFSEAIESAESLLRQERQDNADLRNGTLSINAYVRRAGERNRAWNTLPSAARVLAS